MPASTELRPRMERGWTPAALTVQVSPVAVAVQVGSVNPLVEPAAVELAASAHASSAPTAIENLRISVFSSPVLLASDEVSHSGTLKTTLAGRDLQRSRARSDPPRSRSPARGRGKEGASFRPSGIRPTPRAHRPGSQPCRPQG